MIISAELTNTPTDIQLLVPMIEDRWKRRGDAPELVRRCRVLLRGQA